jgi:hypothetical protein
MSDPLIYGISIGGKSNRTVIEDLGTALLQVKTQRGLRLSDMADGLQKSDDQVAKYIAGEAEMGVVTFLRACEQYPELVERMTETAADRAAKARQRPLDLELQARRGMAA